MLQILASKCIHGKYFKDKNMNEVQVMSFIDKKMSRLGDWNLDAQEAVYYGMADAILGDPGFETIPKIRK